MDYKSGFERTQWIEHSRLQDTNATGYLSRNIDLTFVILHRLLFKPLYNFHFLSVPKVALVKGFNCTVVNAKSKLAKLLVGL